MKIENHSLFLEEENNSLDFYKVRTDSTVFIMNRTILSEDISFQVQ